MIKVHHLNNSRSQRILWLLEELGTDYDLIKYERDATTNLAPDALKQVHPLGKSPVIEDKGATIAESGAIIDYLVRTYGSGQFMPSINTPSHEKYLEWLHFAEGSAMLPILLRLYVGRLGDAGAPLHPRIQSEIDNHLAYVSDALRSDDWLIDNQLSGADFLMSFVVEAGYMSGETQKYANLDAYRTRIQDRPAYRAALSKGGFYAMGPQDQG